MEYIEDFLEIYDYTSAYMKVSDAKAVPPHIKDMIDFLRIKANFGYSNVLSDNPFEQAFWFVGGPESIKIEELEEADINQLIDIIKYTANYFLKAKLYDIAGVVTQEKKYKKYAADNYSAYILSKFNNPVGRKSLGIATMRALYLNRKIRDPVEKQFAHRVFSLQYNDKATSFALKYFVVNTLSAIKSPALKEFIHKIESMTCALDSSISKEEYFLDLIKILIYYYGSTDQPEKYLASIDRYVYFCEEACHRHSPRGYRYLDKALELISADKLKDRYEDKIYELLFLKDDEQKKAYKSMSFVTLPLDENISAWIEKEYNRATEQFQSYRYGAHQLFYLISNFLPMTKKQIDRQLQSRKNTLLDLVNEVRYREDGTIEFESAYATDDEKRKVNTAEILAIDMQIKFNIVLLPFIQNVKADDSLKEVISSVLENNLFVPKDRQNIIYKIILDGFDGNIRKALYDLIPQFEYGLTQFLKSKRIYPVMHRGSHRVPIDLNHMLNGNIHNNKFRDKIAKIIGQNLTITLEYLLCSTYLGNLRNNNYHSGYSDPEEYTIYEAAAFYFMIKAYCFACN